MSGYSPVDHWLTLRLGESETELELQTSDDVRHATDLMVQQATHSLDIFSRDLDEAIYDREAFLDAIRQLCIRNRKTEIRVLIQEPKIATKSGHRFIDLARKLSSSIEMRHVYSDYQQYNKAFLIADRIGMIKRPFADLFEGSANFNCQVIATRQREFFTEVWERSSPHPDLRQLYI
ncbi:MAG: hypothetical protein V3W04_11390 [Gammaproteobacteria bacterium]